MGDALHAGHAGAAFLTVRQKKSRGSAESAGVSQPNIISSHGFLWTISRVPPGPCHVRTIDWTIFPDEWRIELPRQGRSKLQEWRDDLRLDFGSIRERRVGWFLLVEIKVYPCN